jgi:primase-polymerase (primpol)-like protein
VLLLHSMTPWTPGGDPRQTSDPATWHDWMGSVRAARASEQLPDFRSPPPE